MSGSAGRLAPADGTNHYTEVPGAEGSPGDRALHPDRLLPVDPAVRAVAREVYGQTRDLPIVSPHGHVDPAVLARDEPFADPAALFVTPDHYVTRLLHASGVPLDAMRPGGGQRRDEAARSVWRTFCAHWPVFRGTAVRAWIESELVEIFGVAAQPSASTADAIFDAVAARLADAAFRPRALYERFGITALATTADPCDDLAVYAELAADPSWTGRVVPSFRPDRYLEPDRPDWRRDVERLAAAADCETGDYDGFVRALEGRRRAFVAFGATSADHSHLDAGTETLELHEARRVYRAALRGAATPGECTAFRRHMLCEMARMSCEDGLVMTLHCGVLRDHHGPTAARVGQDAGADIPVRAELTRALRPLLERFGTHPGFHLVVFTVDETVWSRELAPLAGFYPSVYVGAPWWFLDAPAAIRRFREAVTETAGFTRTAGFVDDARAFCSIPARHDMARRLDAGYLAHLVAEHRLGLDEAADVAVDLVTGRPRQVFKL